ncbi:MAG: class I SAM-dependent methyltransferase [Candidatus Binataceae bacterium]|nr:class I SAM-dependent methyltransferase [Candidatus Binataceae bacterium]
MSRPAPCVINFTPDHFRRIDESADENFYDFPRKTVHIDDSAIATVREIYLARMPSGGRILDLMSSWRSHLAAELAPLSVVGVGLNRPEMEDNPALTEIVVHNVNRSARLPLDDRSFDGAVMTVSVQYLTNPIQTFAEVGRVLRPGAPFVVTFSNRMFPTKAAAIWVNSSELERILIVEEYFRQSGCFQKIEVIGQRHAGPLADPVYAVLGFRDDA